MRNFLVSIFLLAGSVQFFAQKPAPAVKKDTTIYDIVDVQPIPVIAGCFKNQPANWTRDSLRKCAENQLLVILSSNIRYPEAARQKNTKGQVVLSYVIEPNGKVSNIGLLKDIGDGCGAEAIRVMKALQNAGLYYLPAIRGADTVRYRQHLPVRFKLEDPLPYYINPAGDTVYTVLNTGPVFRGGLDSLAKYSLNQLKYPAGQDSTCLAGIIEMSLLIRPDGAVKIDNVIDFNNLGMDFQFEAIRLANRTIGMWKPAMYQGKPVTTTQPLRVVFESENAVCKLINLDFEKAILLANEGADLMDKKQADAAIEKWNAALSIQPKNTEWLYYRGTALLNMNRQEDACKDFSRIKEILGITWFENMRKIACGF